MRGWLKNLGGMLESWGGGSFPPSPVRNSATRFAIISPIETFPGVAQVLPMLSIDGRLGDFKCRVNRASHTQIYPLSHAIFAVPMH